MLTLDVKSSWAINLPANPTFGRPPYQFRIAHIPESKYTFDNWLDMNIQSGSQWDGLRH